jgi:predicted metal-binding membrane protein
MAAMMAAMMVPTAAPFFFAYGRDTRRPAAVAITIAIYVAVWGVIGALAGLAMDKVMLPSSLLVGAAAIAFAVLYTLSPWSRRARAGCREMCMRAQRGSSMREALVDGATYAECCLVCSAGVMAALVVLGMSNVFLIVAAAALLFVYKLTDWGALVPVLRGR